MSLVNLNAKGVQTSSHFASSVPSKKEKKKDLRPESIEASPKELTVNVKPLKEEDSKAVGTAALSQERFGGLRKFYNDTATLIKDRGLKVAASAAEKVGKWYQLEDEAFLRELTGSSEAIDLIGTIAPWAPSALKNIFPETLSTIADEKKQTLENAAKSLFIHCLANLAQNYYPKETKYYFGEGNHKIKSQDKVPFESLLEKISWHLILLLAEEIESIDAAIFKGAKLDCKLFEPLASKILEKLLPANKQNMGAKISSWGEKALIGYFFKDLTLFLMKTYVFLDEKFSNDPSFFLTKKLSETDPPQEPKNETVNKFAFYLAGCLSKGLKNNDDLLLTKLTGSRELQILIETLAPLLSKFISKEAEFSTIIEALLLNMVSNIIQEIFYKELEQNTIVPVDDLIVKIHLYLFTHLEETFQKADQSNRISVEVNDKLFFPLAEKLLKMILPKNPLLIGFLERRKDKILKPISLFFFEIYWSDIQDIENYKMHLRNLFWDPARIEVKQKPLGMLPTKPTRELSITFGLEKFIDQLISINQFLSNQAVNSLIHFFGDKNNVFKLMLPFFKEYNLSDKLLEKICLAISILLKSKSPSCLFVKNWFENTFNLILIKGITHLFEKVPPEFRKSKKRFFGAAVQLFLATGSKHLPKIYENMDKSLKKKNEEEYFNKEFYKDLEPLINDLIHLFFEDDPGQGKKTLQSHFFGPIELRMLCDKIVRSWLLPSAIGPIFTQTMRWMHTLEASQSTIIKYYKSEHPIAALKLFAELTRQSIPYSFQEKREKIADSLLPYLVKHPKNAPKIKKIVEKTLLSIANNKTEPMRRLLGFVKNFAESSMSFFFAKFTVYIDALEKASKNNPEGPLLIHGTIKFLEELKEHFRLIGDVRGRRKKSPKELEEMLIALHKEGRLHSALTPLLGQSKGADPKWNFFVNLSEQIFTMLGKDEVPAFIRAFVWNLFETKLAPEILETLFNHLKDPHTINLLIAFLFQEVNRNSQIASQKLKEEAPYFYHDTLQTKLEKVSGELIPALVRMHRSGISSKLLKIPAILRIVQRVAGEGIGQSLRKKLQDSTALELILEMIISILPKLHPGEWTKEGKFIGHKLLKNGAKERIEKYDFSHILPRTKEEKKIYEKKIGREKREAEREVVKQVTQTLSFQTKYIFLGFLKKISDRLEILFSKILFKLFGNSGLKLKKSVGKLLRFLSRHIFKPILSLIFYPLIVATGKLMRATAVKRTKDINHKINENIFYRLVSELMILISTETNEPKTKTDLTPLKAR